MPRNICKYKRNDSTYNILFPKFSRPTRIFRDSYSSEADEMYIITNKTGQVAPKYLVIGCYLVGQFIH